MTQKESSRAHAATPRTNRKISALKYTLAALIGTVTLGAGLWLFVTPQAGLANTDEIARGSVVYAENCAACHGANLEGQPDWQKPGPNGRYPAPPHDSSGHTWHHSDQVLAQIIYYGTAAMVGNGYESDMPGFGTTLSEADILAVLAFIKSTWPAQEAAFQRQVTQQN
ncbi:cytochrome c [Phaeovulum sp.]|uniref:c-type cytochrome n=1 Tax=Phaeovulum sp. TaxID=2934796 RepID=UPI00356A4D33